MLLIGSIVIPNDSYSNPTNKEIFYTLNQDEPIIVKHNLNTEDLIIEVYIEEMNECESYYWYRLTNSPIEVVDKDTVRIKVSNYDGDFLEDIKVLLMRF